MASLPLKIKITRINLTKTMNFAGHMSVAEACKSIREKIGEEGGQDHGLFQPAVTGKHGARWLKPERTLQYYDLQPNDELEYKKKHRPIKVKLQDETIKTVLVDDTLSVSDIVKVLGEKMSISNVAEEFSLKVEGKDEWLNGTLSLQEQGVPEEAMLLLRKKFFVSDASVSTDDPVSLHLVYVESRDNILAGHHPCSQEEGVMFAALQLQIQLGNYDPNNPKKFNLKDFFPPSFHKNLKKLEPLVIKEYRKLVGMQEVNAKYRYVQVCRSLKTYGITFFNVKQKIKGQKKPKPLNLGITRSSLIFMDAETKEIDKENPLTHLRRWAAAPTTFTLDFGDHEDDYIVLVTNEGEAISSLLSGYIDILLKKRKDVGAVKEEDDGAVGVEEIIAPIKAKAIGTTTTSIVGGFDGYGGSQYALNANSQTMHRTGANASGQAVPTNLMSATSYVGSLISDLGNKQTGAKNTALTPEQWKKQMISNMEVLMTSVAKLTGTSSGKFDRNLLDNKAAEIASNLAQLISAAKNATKKNGEDDQDLLDGARKVAEAIRDLLAASKDLSDRPEDPLALERFALAQKALSAAVSYIHAASKGVLSDPSSQKLLLESAKNVMDATFNLVSAASEKAQKANDSRTRDLINTANDKTENAAKQLNTEVAILAPAILHSGVKKQIEDTTYNLESAMRQLMATLGDDDPNLLAAAKMVSDAIAQLLATTSIAEPKDDLPDFSLAAKEVLDEAAKLMSATTPQQINQGMKAVIAATTKLVTSAKQAASLSDDETRDRLLACAKAVAAATQRLVAAAGPAAANINDPNARDALADACQRLSEATKALIGNAQEKAALQNLRSAAKIAAAATTGLIANARSASASCNDPISNENLKSSSKAASEAIQKLVQSLQNVYLRPEDKSAQQGLIKDSHDSSPQAYKLVAAAKSALPKISDPGMKQGLRQAADDAADALQKLVAAHKAVMLSGGQKDIDEALDRFSAEEANIDSALLASETGNLQGDGSQTADGALQLLNLASKQVANAAKQMATTAKTNPDELGPTAKAFADAITQANTASIQLASHSNPSVAKDILEAAKALTKSGKAGLSAARAVAANPTDANLNNGLANASKSVADALNALLNATKGAASGARDIDEAIAAIQATFGTIQSKPTNAKEFAMHAEDLENSIKAVQSAIHSLVNAAKTNPKALGSAAKALAGVIPSLIEAANSASGACADPATQKRILDATRALANALTRLLTAAKNASLKDDQQTRTELANAAKIVSDSLETLLQALNTATPGQASLDDAIKVLNDAIIKLQSNAKADVADVGATLESLKKATTMLGEATKGIMTNVKADHAKLGDFSKSAATNVTSIANSARSLAETGGRSSAYSNIAEKVRAIGKDLLNACQSKDPSAKQNIVKAAKEITASTQELVDNVKTDATRIDDDEVRTGLMQSAQGVANATSGMVNSAKAVAQGQPGANQKLTQTHGQLNDALDNLLGQEGGKITTSKAKKMVTVASEAATNTKKMVEISKSILRRPNDADLQSELTNSARAVGAAIKGLLDAAKSLGEVDLDQFIEKISGAITDLDSASISATVGLLENTAPPGKTTQSLEEELVEVSKLLANSIKDVVESQKESPAALAKAAATAANLIPKMADVAKQASGTMTDQEKQLNSLGLAKGIADTALELMQACKQNDGKEVANSAKNMSAAIGKLLGALKGGVIALRDCDEAAKQITESSKKLGAPSQKSGKRYAESQRLLTDQAKQLVSGIAKVVSSAKAQPQEVGDASKKVATIIDSFVNNTQDAVGAISEAAAQEQLLQSARNVTEASTKIIQTAKVVASDPKNAKNQQKLSSVYKEVTDAISGLVGAIKGAATGEIKCEAATESVSRNIAELDGAALYAATGQLQPESDDLDIEDVQTDLLNSCDNLGEDVMVLIAAASKSENELGDASASVAEKFDRVTKETKTVSSLLNNLLTQQNLLGGAKGVGVAVKVLIQSALKVHQHATDQAEKKKLVDASQNVSNALKEFVNLAQTASSAASQGIKELETARKAIQGALDEIDSLAPNQQAGAAEVLKSAKGMADSIALILATCGSNEDSAKLVKGAEDTQEHSIALLSNVKGALRLATNADHKNRLFAATKAAVESIPTFLAAAKDQRKQQTPDTMNATGAANEEVARLIGDLVEAAKVLPGSEEALKLFQESDELERLAESELLNAANAIEAAARTLIDAKNRQLEMRKNKDSPLPEEEIAEAILDAAKAITVATGILVNSATVAQKELVSKGKVSQAQNVYRRDPAWAKGLISAAQQVAGSVGELVASANNVASGKIEEEALVAAAKGVAGATARLVFASRAKADPFSPTQQKLSAAAKSVAAATQQLVTAAKAATQISQEEESKPDWEATTVTGARKMEMEQQMKILKLQKELENAQKHLGDIRKAEYADSGSAPAPAPQKKTATAPAPAPAPAKNVSSPTQQPRPQPTPQQGPAPVKTAPGPGPAPAKGPAQGPAPVKGAPAPGPAPAKGPAQGPAPAKGPAQGPAPVKGAPGPAPAKGPAQGPVKRSLPTPTKFYSLAELQQKPNECDPSRLETYLSDDEFQATFGMSKQQFGTLPEFKRSSEKAKVGL